MVYWAKLKKILLNIISSDFSLEEEIEILRHVFLINLMLSIGIIFTFILGIVAIVQGGIVLFIADVILFSIFFSIMLYLRRTKRYNVAAKLSVVFSGIFFLFFVASGGIANTAFVWAYTYPLIALFMLGAKRGTVVSLILLFLSIVSFIASYYVSFLAHYDINLVLRFVPSYLTVMLLAYIMESTRKIVQERLFEMNEKLREVNQFKTDLLNMTVHDLKNPLNTISGVTEMLKEEKEKTEDTDELLGIISRSSNSMLSLIGAFLESTSLEDPSFKLEKEKLEVNRILQFVVENLKLSASNKNQTLQFSSSEHSYILGDEQYLIKIFENILSNSIKYSPYDSKVEIKIKNLESFIEIKFIDNGAGFSKEDIEKAFARFQKLSAKPTGGESSNGLGLFIVKKLVDLHEGKIWIESEKGKGAAVTLQFPKISD